MFTNLHGDFIKEPLINIYINGLQACSVLSDTIDNYPLREYCLQSIFLRMCGAQEQKLKCILWDLASYDLEFRHTYLSSDISASAIKGKIQIYNRLVEACFSLYEEPHNKEKRFRKVWADVSVPDEYSDDYATVLSQYRNNLIAKLVQEQQIINSDNLSVEQIKNKELSQKELLDIKSKSNRCFLSSKRIEQFIQITNDSVFEKWCERDYSSFKANYGCKFNLDNLTPESLLPSDWYDAYNALVYKFRNICAHNINSYRANLPTLDELCNPDYSYRNYFYRFLLLFIIDEAFIWLFEHYMKLQRSTVFYT